MDAEVQTGTPWAEFLTQQRKALAAAAQKLGLDIEGIAAREALPVDADGKPTGRAMSWPAIDDGLTARQTHALLGPPGIGKTVLAMRTVYDRCAAAAGSTDTVEIPVYLDATTLDIPVGAPEKIVDALAHAITSLSPEGTGGSVIEALLTASVFVAIDGVDRLAEPARGALLKALAWLDGGGVTLLVTADDHNFVAPGPLGSRWLLEPLTNAARGVAVGIHAGDGRAPWDDASRGRLGDTLRDPYLLALATKHAIEPIPPTVAGLLDAIIEAACPAPATRTWLTALAWQAWCEDPGGVVATGETPEVPGILVTGRFTHRAWVNVTAGRKLSEDLSTDALKPWIHRADAREALVLAVQFADAPDAIARLADAGADAERLVDALLSADADDATRQRVWTLLAEEFEAERQADEDVLSSGLVKKALRAGALHGVEAAEPLRTLTRESRGRKRGRRRGKGDLTALTAFLESDNPMVQWLALAIAGRAAGRLAPEQLDVVRQIADDAARPLPLRSVAAAAVVAAEPAAVIAAFRDRVSADPTVRLVWIHALGGVSSREAFDALQTLLVDAPGDLEILDAQCRIIAHGRVDSLGERDALIALCERALGSVTPSLKRHGLVGLGNLGHTEHWPAAAALARAPGETREGRRLRIAAMDVCAQFASRLPKEQLDYATALFVPIVKDARAPRDLRRSAAQGLANLAPRNPNWGSELELLFELLEDSDPVVVRAALNALEHLGEALLDPLLNRLDRARYSTLVVDAPPRIQRRIALRILATGGSEEDIDRAATVMSEWLSKNKSGGGKHLSSIVSHATRRIQQAGATAPRLQLLVELNKRGGRPDPGAAKVARGALDAFPELAYTLLGHCGTTEDLTRMLQASMRGPEDQRDLAAEAFTRLTKRLHSGAGEDRRGRGRGRRPKKSGQQGQERGGQQGQERGGQQGQERGGQQGQERGDQQDQQPNQKKRGRKRGPRQKPAAAQVPESAPNSAQAQAAAPKPVQSQAAPISEPKQIQAQEAAPKPAQAEAPKPAQEAAPKPVQAAAPKPAQEASPKPATAEAPKPTQEAAPKPATAEAPKPTQEAAPKPATAEAPKPAQEAAPKPVQAAAPKPAQEAAPKPAEPPVQASTPVPATSPKAE